MNSIESNSILQPRRNARRGSFFAPPAYRDRFGLRWCIACGKIRSRRMPIGDPRRVETTNNLVATRGGDLIAGTSGSLFDDVDPCKCCDGCACEIPPTDPAYCGACWPRGWTLIVNGVLACPCANYPPWQITNGLPNGTYCATPRPGAGFWFAMSPCQWGAFCNGGVRARYNLVPDPPPPGYNCDSGDPEDSFQTTILFGFGGIGLFCSIEAHGVGPSNRAGGQFFYDEQLNVGPSAIYVFTNRVNCGAVDFGVGHGGTVTAIPCCAGMI